MKITYKPSIFNSEPQEVSRETAARILRKARALKLGAYWHSRAGRYGTNADPHGYRIPRGTFMDWAHLWIDPESCQD